MSKEAVVKLENEYKNNIWKNSKSMINYAVGKISDCYETSKGYLIEFEKPSIETSFCFGYDGYIAGDDERAAGLANEARKNTEYFIKRNLESITDLINWLKTQKAYVTKNYDDAVQSRCLVFENYLRHYEENPSKFEELEEKDIQGLLEVAESEKVKFEKRLRTYLKRYSTSKLNVWTYYRD